jgi:hypothetical protein
MPRSSHALFAALVIALPFAASAASPQSFEGEYTVSFLGLSIARSTFSSRYENGAYVINGTVTAAGLGKLFDDTRGTISSKGKISGKKLVPQAFRADYTSGMKVSAIDIRFTNGAHDYAVYSRTVRTGFGADGRNNPRFSDGVMIRRGGRLISNQSCNTAVGGDAQAEDFMPEGTILEFPD